MRITAVDSVLSSVRVECPHERCGLYVTYHKLADHQSVCPLAPCKCPVPVCGYEGPPPALYHHISTAHPMPVHRIQCGKVLQLQVPPSEPQLLLFAEEDDRAFFLVGGVLDIVAPITVSSASEQGRTHCRNTWPSCGRKARQGTPKAQPTPSRWKWR